MTSSDSYQLLDKFRSIREGWRLGGACNYIFHRQLNGVCNQRNLWARFARRFVLYEEKRLPQATELIWKPRCTATISWEREQGITPAQKKAVYNGPRRDWSAGYGFKFGPDFCPCSHLLADHHNGHCPGPVRDPLAADYKLLECWLGKQHRSTMEGVGKIPFL